MARVTEKYDRKNHISLYLGDQNLMKFNKTNIPFVLLGPYFMTTEDLSYYCCMFTTVGTAGRNSCPSGPDHTDYWRGNDPN